MPVKKMNSGAIHKKRKVLTDIKNAKGRMRDATLSKQEYKKPDGSKQGPYYTLQGYDDSGEHYSQRIPLDMVATIQKEIENFHQHEKRLKELASLHINDNFFKK